MYCDSAKPCLVYRTIPRQCTLCLLDSESGQFGGEKQAAHLDLLHRGAKNFLSKKLGKRGSCWLQGDAMRTHHATRHFTKFLRRTVFELSLCIQHLKQQKWFLQSISFTVFYPTGWVSNAIPIYFTDENMELLYTWACQTYPYRKVPWQQQLPVLPNFLQQQLCHLPLLREWIPCRRNPEIQSCHEQPEDMTGQGQDLRPHL